MATPSEIPSAGVTATVSGIRDLSITVPAPKSVQLEDMDVTNSSKESNPDAISTTISPNPAPPAMVSSMASLPFSSRKRKINYGRVDHSSRLSKLDECVELAQDFTFEIRDQVHAPKIVSVNGKRKQVLSFVLYDRTHRSFECSVWDKRVNGVYMLLTSLELPSCVYISHAKCHPPSKRHVPKTAIKDLQLTIDNHAVVDLSTLPPPSAATSIVKRKCIECDCPKKCDRSCRVLRPSEPWTLARLASKLSGDGEIKTFRNIHIRICGLPKVKGGSLECNVSDGSFMARFEGQYPNFEIGNGTVLELDVFDALFYCHAPGKLALKIIPHDVRPIKPSVYEINHTDNVRLLTPSDAASA